MLFSLAVSLQVHSAVRGYTRAWEELQEGDQLTGQAAHEPAQQRGRQEGKICD